MKAMILAAGKGERMQPLTLTRPKPLLPAAGKPLLEHWLQRLEAAGINEIVINVSYLGEQIEAYIKARGGTANIVVIREGEPLETGGALFNALPLLGDEPFLLINGDVFCEMDLHALVVRAEVPAVGAYLVLAANPAHNVTGDFVLSGNGIIKAKTQESIRGGGALTFSGLSVISPELIRQYPNCRQKFPLREVFYWALEKQNIRGESYSGYWLDVGTPERLAELNDYLRE